MNDVGTSKLFNLDYLIVSYNISDENEQLMN